MRTTLWNELKSFVLATLVAALVWVYAEGESLSTRTVGMNITLPSDPAGNIVLRPQDPNFKGVVRVRLEGNTRTIDEAANMLTAGLKLAPGAPGVPAEPGPSRTIDLREAISALTDLKDLGSSVADVDPQFVRVDVLRLAVRELPVRVELGMEVPLDGDPVAQPATVTLRVPEQFLAALPESASIVATIAADDLRRIKGDGPQTLTATCRPPSSLANVSPISLSVESVTVKLRIRRKVESIKVATVPVWFSLPPTEGGGKWSVEIQDSDKFLTDVPLTGPSDDIERIRTGELAIKAFVELSTDELERGITTKPVTFSGLPATITAPTPAPSVRLKVTRRDGLPAGSPTKP